MSARHRARQQRPDENRKWFQPVAAALLFAARVIYDLWKDNTGC